MPGILSGRPSKTIEQKRKDGDTAGVGAGVFDQELRRKGELPPGRPVTPGGLTPQARRMFEYILKSDRGGRIFRYADGTVVGELASVMADLSRIRAIATNLSTIGAGRAGTVAERLEAAKGALDAYRATEKLSQRYVALADRCGMSPLARARLELGVGGRDAEDGVGETETGELEMPAPALLVMKAG